MGSAMPIVPLQAIHWQRDVAISGASGVIVDLLQPAINDNAVASGTAAGAQTNNSLQDTGAAFPDFTTFPTPMYVIITGGTGAGQVRKITSNTGIKLNTAPNWVTTPVAASSTYRVSNVLPVIPIITAISLTGTCTVANDLIVVSAFDGATSNTVWTAELEFGAIQVAVFQSDLFRAGVGPLLQISSTGATARTLQASAEGYYMSNAFRFN